jgi:hypothetical protein
MNKLLTALLLVASTSLPWPALGQGGAEESLSLDLVPDHLAYLYGPPSEAFVGDTHSQLYAEKRRWENGRRLRVCFYNGNPVVVKLIRTIASEWNPHSGVVLDFGPDGTWLNCLNPRAGFPEIRVGFSERGYWSYIGSDSERYGGDRAPSMNFDSFNRLYNEFQYSAADVVPRARLYHKATIRHEFGHALGLLHEHQNPNLNCYKEIKWDGPGNVYDYFASSPNFWSKEQVDRNLGFVGATDSDYISGDPDPKSVMMYSLSPAIFRIGAASRCATPVNYEISEKDRLVVSKIYPATNSLQVGAFVNEDILSAYVKPAPQFIVEAERSDYTSRIISDLESADTATRRNARARLSQILQHNTDQRETNKIIAGVQNSSYRYKLGVATALSNADGKVEVSPEAARVLARQSSVEKDPTLKSSLRTAQRKVEVK